MGAGEKRPADCEEVWTPCCDDDVEDMTYRHAYKPGDLWFIGVLSAVVVFIFADQNLLAPNLSAVAAEFGFDDTAKDKKLGGDIAVAFFGFGAPASLLVGYLTDVTNRRNLFALTVLLGEGGSLATVWVQTYTQLYWLRALTGVAIGGALPLIFSIIGDLVPASHRAQAAGWIGVALSAGGGMGQLVAGLFGHGAWLGWRLPFLLIAVPSLLLALLLLLTTTDPPRGSQEAGLSAHIKRGGEYSEKVGWKNMHLLATSKTVLLIFLQGAPGCVPWGVISTYLSDFLYKQRGLNLEHAALVVFMYGVGGGIGMVLGGPLGQWLYNFNKRLQPLFMGVCTIGGVIPVMVVLDYEGGSMLVYGAASVVAGMLSAVTGPNIRSILLNVTAPVTRGTAFGMYNLCDDLGKGLGVYFISLMIEGMGRQRAFNFAIQFWLVCGVCLLLMSLTVVADEHRVQSHLKEYSAAQLSGVLDDDDSGAALRHTHAQSPHPAQCAANGSYELAAIGDNQDGPPDVSPKGSRQELLER